MLIALLAAGCMVCQDILATIMVQAEAANRGWLAGLMDMLGFVAISTTAISVNALNGHGCLINKVLVLAFVGAANVFGTKLGQVSGHWLLTRKARIKANLRRF